MLLHWCFPLRVFEDADYESELNEKNKNNKWRFQYGRTKFKL